MNPWTYLGIAENKKMENLKFREFITEDNISSKGKYTKVQGLLCLNDVKEDDGGFFTVPGFSSQLEKWAEKNIEYGKRFVERGSDFVVVLKDDEMISKTQKITAR